MKRFFGALLLLGLGACASTRPPGPLDVAVTRSGESWTADFHFPRRARAWAFLRSSVTRSDGQPWRSKSWTVETPGVQLERRGHYDVLSMADGRRLPEWVRIHFTPFPRALTTDYDPALIFTDGSVALFSEQFDAFPLRSARRAERLPVDLSGTDAPPSPTRVTFTDTEGAVLHSGARVPSVRLDDDEATYVLFGPAEPVEAEAMTTIIDPELPDWIRESLLRDMPAILGRYAAAFGRAPGPKPILMVSWAGPTPRLTSINSGVLNGMMVMTYEGRGVLVENPRLRRRGLWFVAHEGAHFWLGQLVTYQFTRDAWITEGGADLLAIRTVPDFDPSYEARAVLQEAVDDCVALTRDRPLETAEAREEHRAYYACGTVFALIAEAASRRPFVDFIGGLIEANRNDRVVTRADWLSALDSASGDPSLSADIGRLLDHGAADPGSTLASLFTRAGIAFALAEDGTPRLQ